MLTNSCVKLQTVHTIPMTMNKEGKVGFFLLFFLGFNTHFHTVLFLLDALHRRRIFWFVRLPKRHRPLCVRAETELK